MKKLPLYLIAICLISGIWQPILNTAFALQEDTRLHLKKGQYLTVILPETNPANNHIRQSYYAAIAPLSQKYNVKREVSLKVDQSIISEYAPSAALFFSYPDKASAQQLSTESVWPEIISLRSRAWKEIKFYSAEIKTDLNIKFDPEKTYTLVVAWANPEHPNDYFRYLDAIKPLVNEAGGRFIYKMQKPSYEANTNGQAPTQLTFVEWDSVDSFAKLNRNPSYKKHVPLRTNGIQKLEFYQLSVPQK